MVEPWEGDDPKEAPPEGTVLVAAVRVGGRVKGMPRKVCLVTRSGVYPPVGEEGKPTPWAWGSWQRADGSWTRTLRVLMKPWHPVQLPVPLEPEVPRG